MFGMPANPSCLVELDRMTDRKWVVPSYWTTMWTLDRANWTHLVYNLNSKSTKVEDADAQALMG